MQGDRARFTDWGISFNFIIPFLLGGLIIHETFRFSCFIMHKKEAHMVVRYHDLFHKGGGNPWREGSGERESVIGSHNNHSTNV